MRLVRYNLAETSHPADIHILIGVTIYSNNLTMHTHAEQMGWLGAQQVSRSGGKPQERVAGLLGGAQWEIRGSPPLATSR